MERFHFMWKVLWRSPAIIASSVLLCIATFMPALFSVPVFGTSFIRLQAESSWSQVEQLWDEGFYDGAGAQELDWPAALRTALGRAVSSRNDRDFYSAMVDANSAEKAMASNSQLDADHGYLDGYGEFYRAMMDAGSPPSFEVASSMPAFAYLSYVTGTTPPFLLFLPALASGYIAASTWRRRILACQAPRLWTDLAAAIVVPWVVAMLATLAVFVPSFAVMTLRNGLGDLVYPVAFLTGGMTHCETLGHNLATSWALMATGALCLVATCVVVGKSCGEVFGACASLAMALSPYVLFGNPSVPDFALSLWAGTYLMPGDLCGYAGYFVAADPDLSITIEPFPDAFLACFLSAVLSAIVAALAVLIRRTARGIAVRGWTHA